MTAKDSNETGRALLVLTSHGQLGSTGRSTGFWVGEAAHPWAVFTEAGLGVDLVSTKGGEPPRDGEDRSDPVQDRFLTEMADALATTPTPGEIDPERYRVIFFVGGHGAMWDFPTDPDLPLIASEIYAAGGVVAAVCHGPAGLVRVSVPGGALLVADHRVTGFTNAEESARHLTDVVPFLLQDKLTQCGGEFSAGEPFESHVVTDGRLVTGQNPASAADTARAVIAALG